MRFEISVFVELVFLQIKLNIACIFLFTDNLLRLKHEGCFINLVEGNGLVAPVPIKEVGVFDGAAMPDIFPQNEFSLMEPSQEIDHKNQLRVRTKNIEDLLEPYKIHNHHLDMYDDHYFETPEQDHFCESA